MAGKVRPIPEGYHAITPYLVVKGAARAIDFYKKVFGAREKFRMHGPGGTVAHAELVDADDRLIGQRRGIGEGERNQRDRRNADFRFADDDGEGRWHGCDSRCATCSPAGRDRKTIVCDRDVNSCDAVRRRVIASGHSKKIK